MFDVAILHNKENATRNRGQTKSHSKIQMLTSFAHLIKNVSLVFFFGIHYTFIINSHHNLCSKIIQNTQSVRVGRNEKARLNLLFVEMFQWPFVVNAFRIQVK